MYKEKYTLNSDEKGNADMIVDLEGVGNSNYTKFLAINSVTSFLQFLLITIGTDIMIFKIIFGVTAFICGVNLLLMLFGTVSVEMNNNLVIGIKYYFYLALLVFLILGCIVFKENVFITFSMAFWLIRILNSRRLYLYTLLCYTETVEDNSDKS